MTTNNSIMLDVQKLNKRFSSVQAVKDHNFNGDTVGFIKKCILQGCLGEPIEVDVELVRQIKRKPGKMRTVVSLVK